MSVPVARRVVDVSLRTIGVLDHIVHDVLVALTEASTNVLKHAGPGDEYVISVRLDDASCVIEVKDLGVGLSATQFSAPDAGTDAETGRGFQLMRALVDDVQFTSDPSDGTVVCLRKQLEYAQDSLLAKAPSPPPPD